MSALFDYLRVQMMKEVSLDCTIFEYGHIDTWSGVFVSCPQIFVLSYWRSKEQSALTIASRLPNGGVEPPTFPSSV